MKYLLALLLMFSTLTASAAFTEFYCDAAAGDNTNAGSTAGSPVYSEDNGDFVASTGVFTADDALDLSGVSAGMWMSGMNDADTEPDWVARVTAVDDGANTITVSTTAKAGTLSDLTDDCKVRVGGAWAGPTASTNFPFPFVANTMTNSAGDYPRINFKSGTNYLVEAENAINNPGPIKFQGYTTTVGDGGRAVFDGLTTGTAYRLFYATNLGDYIIIEDLEFQNNGDTGLTEAVRLTGEFCIARRCVVHDVSTIGFYLGNQGPVQAIECEAYACNQNNQNLYAGIYVHSPGCRAIRCVSHSHVVSNGTGFYCAGPGASVSDSIAFGNAEYGGWAGEGGTYLNCDFYANGSDGLLIRGTSGQGTSYIENCNFVDNGGYGINGDNTNPISGYVVNCGFGAGTMANTSGQTNGLDDFDIIGSVTYANDVTPWVDPANGDFRIDLAAAQGTGRGAFLQTDGSHAGTVSYPDIGAAQHEDAGGSGATVHMPNLNGNLQ